MSRASFTDGLDDADDVAEHVVEEWASANQGIAEVIPASEIEAHLDDALDDPEAISETERESIVDDVKDAVLDRDVVIV